MFGLKLKDSFLLGGASALFQQVDNDNQEIHKAYMVLCPLPLIPLSEF